MLQLLPVVVVCRRRMWVLHVVNVVPPLFLQLHHGLLVCVVKGGFQDVSVHLPTPIWHCTVCI